MTDKICCKITYLEHGIVIKKCPCFGLDLFSGLEKHQKPCYCDHKVTYKINRTESEMESIYSSSECLTDSVKTGVE